MGTDLHFQAEYERDVRRVALERLVAALKEALAGADTPGDFCEAARKLLEAA